MNLQVPGPASSLQKVMAPLLAGVVIGVLCWTRVDSVFYFLHGSHGQGLLLADAIAQGQGFIDLSLPGHPAHVREPPLFYLMLAGLIRVFGMRMYPLKILMWGGYVAGAVLGTILFQRRTKPWLAFLSMVLCMSSQNLFKFFTGPGSDVPFIPILLAAFIAVEGFISRVLDGRGHSRRKLAAHAALAAALVMAVVFMRSLGLALFLGAFAALIVHRGSEAPLRSRAGWALVFAAPVVMALSAWAVRGALIPNPAGYNYLDWFLMDYAPDSPEMIAVDFHAPLMGEIPRTTFFGLVLRGLRHCQYYLLCLVDLAVGPGFMSGLPWLKHLIAFLALAIFLFGLFRAEKGRAPAASFFICIYFSALVLWPMDDPRLLFPFLPFYIFFFALGLYALLDFLFARLLKRWAQSEKDGDISRWIATARNGTVALVLTGIMASNFYHDMKYHSIVSGLPTVSFLPGFEVRFMHKAGRDSFRLLMWAREHAPTGSVLMYHSPPPCRIFSGHVCRSIPFPRDLEEARDFIVRGGADYLVIDEWGLLFTTGPGWFVEQVLRPLVRAYPSDFETVFEVPGTGAKVVKVGS